VNPDYSLGMIIGGGFGLFAALTTPNIWPITRIVWGLVLALGLIMKLAEVVGG